MRRTDFYSRVTSRKTLGPVHTYPNIFESATVSFRIRLSSTRMRRIRKQIRKFLNPLSRVEILNPITFRIRVDGRIRIFSDTMSSQNWRQYLHSSFGLFPVFKLVMQLNVALLNAEISYARRRLDICKLFTLYTGQNGQQKQLKRVGKHCRPRWFWVRPGRTST